MRDYLAAAAILGDECAEAFRGHRTGRRAAVPEGRACGRPLLDVATLATRKGTTP